MNGERMAKTGKRTKLPFNLEMRRGYVLSMFGVLLISIIGLGCSENHKKEDNVVYKRIETAVHELDPDDVQALESLAQRVREKSLKEPRKIVDLLHSKDKKDRENAAAVLLELEHLAFEPLVEKIDLSNPEDAVWEMELAVDLHLADRARLVKILDEMLKDTTVVEPKVMAVEIEEEPVTQRVCDKAYLMMRKLFALEDEETHLVNVEAFLNMSDKERDAEIERAVKTKKWQALEELEEEL